MSSVFEDFRKFARSRLVEKTLNWVNDGKKVRGMFIGHKYGWYYNPEYELGGLAPGQWQIILGMWGDKKRADVEGATETSEDFIESLKKIVKEYPEFGDFKLAFDGPPKPVGELLKGSGKFDWRQVEFYHGTSSAAADVILKDGLKPRSETGVKAAYGAHLSTAKPGNPRLIYLTTQLQMASFASRDAARSTGSKSVILSIKGLDGNYMEPDEDSGESDARASLDKIGSVGYSKAIPARLIKVFRK